MEILEYLGGIETSRRIRSGRSQVLLILEYLGGIETQFWRDILLPYPSDFRIPRRD